MPKLLQKISVSVLASLAVLLVIAPKLAPVQACATNLECAVNPNASGCIPNPNTASGQQKSICSTALTTATGVTNAVSNALSGSPSESTWYNTGFGDWYQKVYDQNVSPGNEIFGERYTAAQVQWVIYGVMSFAINTVLGNSPESQQAVSCLIGSSKDLTACGQAIKGLLSSAGGETPVAAQGQSGLLSMVFADRPLSGVTYVKHEFQNFALIPTAYAQTAGFGFSALEPVQQMWKGARDIAFGLFVIAAVVLAFMIMFRVKISPQVVISVQSAIPKLIIALVLVTFSYAIAGFMVDLMYVVIGILSLLAPSLTVFKIQPTVLFAFLTGSNILLTLGVYIFALVISFVGSMSALMGAPLFAVLTATIMVFLWWLVLLLVVILIVVFIFMAVKTVWALLKAFAGVLLNVIFAPLQIVAGIVIPNFGFGAWLKSLAGNLSVFVVTGALMLLSIVFLINGVMLGLQDFFGGAPGTVDLGATILHFIFGTAVIGQATGQVSGNWPPLLGAGNSLAGVGLIFLGASFVLFTLIPKATEIVQGFISGKPFAYGSAVGEALGPLTAIGGGLWKAGAGIASDIGRTYATQRIFGRTTGDGTPNLDPQIEARLQAQQRTTQASGAPRRQV